MATSNRQPDRPTSRQPSRHRAGLFDIRNIIGLLLLIYGVVLIIMGLVATSGSDKARAGGINANLWSGLGIGLVGAFFIVWALTRPIVVPDDPEAAAADADGPVPAEG